MRVNVYLISLGRVRLWVWHGRWRPSAACGSLSFYILAYMMPTPRATFPRTCRTAVCRHIQVRQNTSLSTAIVTARPQLRDTLRSMMGS